MHLRWLFAVALLATHARAEDKRSDAPRITAIAPLGVIPGQEVTLKSAA